MISLRIPGSPIMDGRITDILLSQDGQVYVEWHNFNGRAPGNAALVSQETGRILLNQESGMYSKLYSFGPENILSSGCRGDCAKGNYYLR